MMCFRDRTFCPFWEECAISDGCYRRLDDEVKKAAEKWWGGEDAPICIYTEKPGCFASLKEGKSGE